MDFLPSKGLLETMKPNRVTDPLWQRWEERRRGQMKKPTLGRLEDEGVGRGIGRGVNEGV